MIDYSKYDKEDVQYAIKNYYGIKMEAYRCMIREGKQAYLDYISTINSTLYAFFDLPTGVFPNGPVMMYEKIMYVYADPNNEEVQLRHKFLDAVKKYKEEKENTVHEIDVEFTAHPISTPGIDKAANELLENIKQWT